MNYLEYQQKAARTLLHTPDFQITDRELMISWNALGLSGEASEILQLVKRFQRNPYSFNDPETKEQFKKELGDVFWYVSALCTKIGVSFITRMPHSELDIKREIDEFIEDWGVEETLFVVTFGLARKCLNFSELVKKQIFHRQGVNVDVLADSLEDVCRSLVNIASVFELTVDEILTFNIQKLEARFPGGYTPERTTYRAGDAA